MRPVSLIAGIVVLVSVAAGWTPCQKSPDRKLVEAELLEVASGDLEGAMAVYQALTRDKNAPEAVRARAMLYLARCHRKKGQLRTAEKLLTDLVKQHAKMKDVVRQARSFLQELRSGKSANPAFDWLGELEKNPEIQARVFQLVMDLAVNNWNTRDPASRQLLALGTLAVPMMERLLKTSRDSKHRGAIAGILVRSGRFEALPVLFESRQSMDGGGENLDALEKQIPRMDAETLNRIRAVLTRIETEPGCAGVLAALRLRLGDTSDLEGKLKCLEFTDREGGLPYNVYSLLEVLKSVVAKGGKEAVLGRRLQNPKCPDEALDLYLEILLEKSLDHLALDRLAPMLVKLKKNFDIQIYTAAIIKALDMRGDHTSLARFMAWPPLRKFVLDSFKMRYDSIRQFTQFPPGWIPVLLAGEYYQEVHQLAERYDSCVKPFAAFLKSRKKIVPAYLGYGGRDPKWRPSVAYARAMKDLLAVDDAVSQAIALEALALAVPVKGEEVLPVLERLILEPRDLNVMEFAMYALLKRFEIRPWTGPEVARILIADYRRHEVRPYPDIEYYNSPLRRLEAFGSLFIGREYKRSGTDYFMKPNEKDWIPIGSRYGRWVIRDIPRETLIRLIPHVRDLSGSDAGFRFFHWLADQVGVINLRKILLETLPGITDLKAGSSVLALKGIEFLKDSPEGRKFLKRVALDRSVDAWRRFEAVNLAWPGSKKWFDWPALLQSEDSLVHLLLLYPGHPGRKPPAVWGQLIPRVNVWLKGLPLEERKSLCEATLKSPDPSIRRSDIYGLILDKKEQRPFYPKMFEDTDTTVQYKAYRYFMREYTVRLAPMLHRILREPKFADLRKRRIHEIITTLVKIAESESLEPLGKLLDDPDLTIRAEALRGLREIRKALEEKQEWKRIIQEMKKGHEKK